jgi:hypothetical protein
MLFEYEYWYPAFPAAVRDAARAQLLGDGARRAIMTDRPARVGASKSVFGASRRVVPRFAVPFRYLFTLPTWRWTEEQNANCKINNRKQPFLFLDFFLPLAFFF